MEEDRYYDFIIGYDDYDPQVPNISEIDTKELEVMLEGLKEFMKIMKKKLRNKDIQSDFERTKEMIEAIEIELKNRRR